MRHFKKVLLSATLFFFVAIHPVFATSKIYITSGTSWSGVVTDGSNITVEAIGGGGGGAAHNASVTVGGGGGAYATASVSYSSASSVSGITIGQGGSAGNDGTDTVWDTSVIIAKAGAGSSTLSNAGGAAASCTPSTGAYSGGSGGGRGSDSRSGAGGGGAAGPFGNGKNGGVGGAGTAGAGGGGAGGLSATDGVGSTGSTTTGSDGGVAQDGTAGGAGGVSADGSPGSHGSGGGGGGDPAAKHSGAAGGNGLEWDSTHGAGGGGGAGAGTSGGGPPSGDGGAGGLYGGGGGGNGWRDAGASDGVSGTGGNGIIVITYTPSTSIIAIDAASNSGYQTSGSSFAWNHTCTGNNRYLAVDINIHDMGISVSGVTFDGNAMTHISGTGNASNAVDSWGLVAPASGTHEISVSLSDFTDSFSVCALSYTGVNQSSPTESAANATDTNIGVADATVTITSTTDRCWIHAAAVATDTSITAVQTSRNNVTGASGSGADEDTNAEKTPAGAQVMSYTDVGAGETWAIVGYAIKPVPPAVASTGNFFLMWDD